MWWWRNGHFGATNETIKKKKKSCSCDKTCSLERQNTAAAAKRAVWSDKILQLWRNVLFGATNETKNKKMLQLCGETYVLFGANKCCS